MHRSSFFIAVASCLSAASLLLLAAPAGVSASCSPPSTIDTLVIGGETISQNLIHAYVNQFSTCMFLFPSSTNTTFRTARTEQQFSCGSCMWGDCLLAGKLPPDEGSCRYYRGPDCRDYKGLIGDMAQPCQ